MTDTPTLREFLRVSKGKGGRETSPDQQHGDHRRDADTQNFQLHPTPYREVGAASRQSNRVRDVFLQLIADLQNGTFGADGLCLWESSRGSRRVSEWALLMDLLAEHKMVVWVHTHARLYDARNHRDRRTLLEEAVDSEYETGKASDRLRRDVLARAAEGRPGGRLSWGYRSVYDPNTGRLLRREPDTGTGRPELVLELFKRFTSGTALSRLETDWALRGIVNGRGNAFTGPQLRDMLRNRTYIGERVHCPGEETRWWKARDRAVITPGQWAPIVPRELFFAAQSILDDPARVTTKPGGARHLLSMVAVCDPCGSVLDASRLRGEAVYRCREKGCVLVPKSDLDKLAMARILDYLSSESVYLGLQQAGEGAAEQVAALDAQIAAAAAELASLKSKVSALTLSVDFAASVEPGMRAQLADLTRRREELAVPSELHGLVGPRDDVKLRLAGITEVARLRRIAALVLTRPMAGELRVLRSPSRGHRVPAKDRVRFRVV